MFTFPHDLTHKLGGVIFAPAHRALWTLAFIMLNVGIVVFFGWIVWSLIAEIDNPFAVVFYLLCLASLIYHAGSNLSKFDKCVLFRCCLYEYGIAIAQVSKTVELDTILYRDIVAVDRTRDGFTIFSSVTYTIHRRGGKPVSFNSIFIADAERTAQIIRERIGVVGPENQSAASDEPPSRTSKESDVALEPPEKRKELCWCVAVGPKSVLVLASDAAGARLQGEEILGTPADTVRLATKQEVLDQPW